MVASVTARFEVGTNEELAAARDLVEDALQGNGVISIAAAFEEAAFTVHGVDLASGEPFTERIEAAHEEAARKKAAKGKGKTQRVVSVVTPVL